ncbi:MAG: 50S ribosomal protein L29 [Methanobacteriota archaeon]
MAELHTSEIGKMSPEEQDKAILELRKSLMKINGGLASGGIPEDVGKAREMRKTIARILTIKHEVELKKK